MTKSQSSGIQRVFTKNFLFFLVIFVPAMALRCWFLISLDETILFYKYPYFAEKLASGENIGTRIVDLSPAYLYLLTLFHRMTPFDWGLFKFVQGVVGAVNCWITAELGRRVFASRAVGAAAGILMAAYGNLIILETTLEPTVFVVFFNLLAVYFLYRYADAIKPPVEKPDYRWLSLSALFTGISIITKPSFLLFIPLACVWIVRINRRSAPTFKPVAVLSLFCVVSFSIVFTITLRNYLLLDDVILVTADAGKVFYHGNSSEATALKWAGVPDQGFIEENSGEPDYAHVAFRSTASKMSGRKLTPSETSKFWVGITLENIAADPGRYFQRQLDKLLFFLSDYELHYIASAYKEYKASLSFPLLRFAWIIAPGLAGMLFAAGRFTRLIPIYGMVLLYLVSGLIFVVQSRYRIPASPYLCLFAAYAIHRVYHLLRGKRIVASLAVIAGILAIAAGSQNVLKKRIISTDKWFQASKIHYEMGAQIEFQAGRYADAVEAASRSLAIAPSFAPAYNLRGKSFALLDDPHAAIEDFRAVVRLRPNRPEGYRNLGFVYLINNEPAKAIFYLEKTLALNPEDKKAETALRNIKAAVHGYRGFHNGVENIPDTDQ